MLDGNPYFNLFPAFVFTRLNDMHIDIRFFSKKKTCSSLQRQCKCHWAHNVRSMMMMMRTGTPTSIWATSAPTEHLPSVTESKQLLVRLDTYGCVPQTFNITIGDIRILGPSEIFAAEICHTLP